MSQNLRSSTIKEFLKTPLASGAWLQKSEERIGGQACVKNESIKLYQILTLKNLK
jgi:hypothetical protein